MFPFIFIDKNYQKIREYLEERGGLQALISILYSPIPSIQEQALKTLVQVTSLSGLFFE